MLKKIYISILVLLVAVLSMTVSVYAWVTSGSSSATADGINGSFEKGGIDVDGGIDVGVFIGNRVENLIYLTNSQFNGVTNGEATDYYGLASHFEITVKNTHNYQVNAKIIFEDADFEDVLKETAGSVSNLWYTYYEFRNVNGIDMPANELFSFNKAKQEQNAKFDPTLKEDILLQAGETKKVYIYTWGNYDSLSNENKKIYHSLTYRVKLSIETISNGGN